MDPPEPDGVWMRAEWDRQSRRFWLAVLVVLLAVASAVGWYLAR